MMALNDQGIPFVEKAVGEKIVGQGFEEFYNRYKLDFADRECAIHFRMRTSGLVDVENAHPYEIIDGTYVMHNGVISIKEQDKDKSDTWHFARVIEEQVKSGWMRHPSFKHLCEMAIGIGNKLVFLDKEGFEFYNKLQGDEFYGCWFSNTYAWSAPYQHYGYQGFYGFDDSEVYAGKASGFRGEGSFPKRTETGSASSTLQIGTTIYLPDGSRVAIRSSESEIEQQSDKKIETQTEPGIEAKIFAEIAKTIEDPEFTSRTDEERADYFQNMEERLRSCSSSEAQTSTSATAVLNALSSDPELEIEDSPHEMVATPATIGEWEDLNLEELQKLNYNEPDLVAETLFSFLQKRNQ